MGMGAALAGVWPALLLLHCLKQGAIPRRARAARYRARSVHAPWKPSHRTATAGSCRPSHIVPVWGPTCGPRVSIDSPIHRGTPGSSSGSPPRRRQGG